MKRFLPQDFPHRKQILGAYRHTLKMYASYLPILTEEDREEMLMAACEYGIAAYMRSADDDYVFLEARRAAARELRRWVNPRLRVWANNQPFDELPVLPIARAIYAQLRKKGRRGRRSATLKAAIIQRHCQGETFEQVSIVLSSLNSHHHQSRAACQRNWLSALGVLFNQSRGNITRA